MEQLSSAQAALKLGVSAQRLRALARAGRLDARKIGGRWIFNSLPVKGRNTRAGRPLSAASAWALLAEICRVPPRWIYASARSRLRRRLKDREWVLEALSRSEPRSKVVKCRVLPVDLQRVRQLKGFVPTGLSAIPGEIDIVSAGTIFDAYVDDRMLRFVIERYRPDLSSREANLTLRIPTHPWVLSLGAAPLAVVAADLLVSSDSRTARAASDQLRALIHG
jgi:hypothetical protein